MRLLQLSNAAGERRVGVVGNDRVPLLGGYKGCGAPGNALPNVPVLSTRKLGAGGPLTARAAHAASGLKTEIENRGENEQDHDDWHDDDADQHMINAQ